MGEVLNVISNETSDPFKLERIEKRVRGTFEYYIRSACDRRRSSRSLRNAMKFFEQKDRHSDPLAALGISIPDFSSFIPPSVSKPKPPADARRESSGPGQSAPDGFQNPASNSQ